VKGKNIVIGAAVAIAVIAGILYWRGAHPALRKRLVTRHIVTAAAIARKKAEMPPFPAPSKKFVNPNVAIVVDDFGYNKNNLDALFDIHEPITISILPDLRYSTEIASLARSRGCEVILHLPLEAHNKSLREERDTIKPGMTEEDIDARLKKEITSLPGLKGVSNHMGSKATEDRALMTAIFKYLKARDLYFSDSLTSQRSVCREVAREVGIPYGRRDIFLDNSDDTDYIERQLSILKKMAFRRGKVIAVCHDKKNTIAILARKMPEMEQEGVRFVYLSEMVK